jgi:hypothetical protein
MMWQSRRIPVHAAHLPQFMDASARSPLVMVNAPLRRRGVAGSLFFRIDH